MEDNKPTYDELEKELQEYQDLLWQLSDEYKLNVGNAEKKISELQNKCNSLEKEQARYDKIFREGSSDIIDEEKDLKASVSSFITNLGLPACVVNAHGDILNFNNKFKFLVELLSFNIDDTNNLTKLFDKDINNNIAKKYLTFQDNEEGLFQSLFSIKNAFNGSVNMLVRIYACKENSDYLAMFIELNSIEAQNLHITTDEVKPQNNVMPQADIEEDRNDNTIEIFAEKYEIYQKLLKIFGTKKRKKPELLPENIYLAFVRAFNLDSDRNNILNSLNDEYKDFSESIRAKFRQLTVNEEKHCMLIKAGLTYKEIAAIMGISVNGVKIARNRLRKKLDIDTETTSEFINELEI